MKMGREGKNGLSDKHQLVIYEKDVSYLENSNLLKLSKSTIVRTQRRPRDIHPWDVSRIYFGHLCCRGGSRYYKKVCS